MLGGQSRSARGRNETRQDTEEKTHEMRLNRDNAAYASTFSPADGAVNQFANEVGVTVVAGVLLDHVNIDPAE